VAIYIRYLNILDYHGFYRNLVMTCYWIMEIQTGFRLGGRHDKDKKPRQSYMINYDGVSLIL